MEEEEPFEHCECLFSADLYIHHIIVNDDVLTRFHQYALNQSSCVLGFRLWNFPLLYIEQKATTDSSTMFLPNGEPASNISCSIGNGTEQLSFNSGKSCMFKMTLSKCAEQNNYSRVTNHCLQKANCGHCWQLLLSTSFFLILMKHQKSLCLLAQAQLH